MTHNQILDELRQPVKDLREHIPAVFDGYAALSGAVLGDGVLDAKTKELIALSKALHRDALGTEQVIGSDAQDHLTPSTLTDLIVEPHTTPCNERRHPTSTTT